MRYVDTNELKKSYVMDCHKRFTQARCLPCEASSRDGIALVYRWEKALRFPLRNAICPNCYRSLKRTAISLLKVPFWVKEINPRETLKES